jgi:predicted nucleotidyltransferase
MISALTVHRAEIDALCRRFHVKRLDVFGSAARGEDFNNASDVDFLVEFEPLAPAAYADAYFSLRDELIALFRRRIDLLTKTSLRNPYFHRRVEAEQRPLFEG